MRQPLTPPPVAPGLKEQSPAALLAAETAGAGPAAPAEAEAEELEKKLMHLRRVNESLVERVEFFERAQVITPVWGTRKAGGTKPHASIRQSQTPNSCVNGLVSFDGERDGEGCVQKRGDVKMTQRWSSVS